MVEKAILEVYGKDALDFIETLLANFNIDSYTVHGTMDGITVNLEEDMPKPKPKRKEKQLEFKF